MAGKMKIFCVRKNFFPRKKNLLFLPCNMAAVQILYVLCLIRLNLYFVNITLYSLCLQGPRNLFSVQKARCEGQTEYKKGIEKLFWL